MNQIRPQHNSHQGFTVVELLVSIAIMALLAAMVVVNFRAGEVERLLDQEAQFMAALIRETQNMAITGQKVDGQVPAGYGVFVTPSQELVLYADFNGSATPDAPNEEIRRISLPPSLRFSAIDVNFLFLPYKTVGGLCWVDYTSCGGNTFQLLVTIQDEEDFNSRREIRYQQETGQISILRP